MFSSMLMFQSMGLNVVTLALTISSKKWKKCSSIISILTALKLYKMGPNREILLSLKKFNFYMPEIKELVPNHWHPNLLYIMFITVRK